MRDASKIPVSAHLPLKSHPPHQHTRAPPKSKLFRVVIFRRNSYRKIGALYHSETGASPDTNSELKFPGWMGIAIRAIRRDFSYGVCRLVSGALTVVLQFAIEGRLADAQQPRNLQFVAVSFLQRVKNRSTLQFVQMN